MQGILERQERCLASRICAALHADRLANPSWPHGKRTSNATNLTLWACVSKIYSAHASAWTRGRR